MKRYHPIITIFWIGLSLFLMVHSYKLGLGRLRDPGPGLMPFIIGVLMFVSSAYLLIAELLKSDVKGKPSEEQEKINPKRICLVTILLIIYGLLLEKLGFAVTTFLLLFFLSRLMTLKWMHAIVFSVLTVAVTYISFTYIGVRLPSGLFKTMGL